MHDGYEDIIGMPHHVSRKRHRMSMSERAAQFAPFAALSGYEEAIRKTEEEIRRSMEAGDNHEESEWNRMLFPRSGCRAQDEGKKSPLESTSGKPPCSHSTENP